MEPISAGLAAVGAISKLSAIPISIRSQRLLEKQLKGLQSQKMARYSIDPKIAKLYEQSIGEASNPEGYGGATYGNFRSALGRNLRSRYMQARSMGGGARGINAVLSGQGLDAINQYAAGDEGMRRSNRIGALGRAGSYASQFQNIRDRNTSFDQNYRLQLERGLGEGIRSQKDYRRNLFSGMGNDLLSAGVMGSIYGNDSTDVEEDVVGVGRGVTPELLSPQSRYYLNRNPFIPESAYGDRRYTPPLTSDKPVNFRR